MQVLQESKLRSFLVGAESSSQGMFPELELSLEDESSEQNEEG